MAGRSGFFSKGAATMKITEITNGSINLNVSNDELEFLQALVEKCYSKLPPRKKDSQFPLRGFDVAVLNHDAIAAMADTLKGWGQYKRLRDKFARHPKHEESVKLFNQRF
jgi:hypothetical protein